MFSIHVASAWAVDPAPDIKALGSDGPISIASKQNLSLTVELDSGDQTYTNADWWLLASTPSGWYYSNLSGGLEPGMLTTYQGPLFNVSTAEILNSSDLPSGAYTFYFGVDMNMNGTPDGALFYDGVTVNIGSVLSYPVVDTGQSSCYDIDGAEISCPVSGEDFSGQDAQYSGSQFSYTDNGDGTVTDNVTGLMWQQIPGSSGLSWQEAADSCSSLELGGIDSWRIPSTKELFSISDFSAGWPYLDTNYFSLAGTGVSKDEQYWADYYVGTTVEGGSAAAFGVNHGTGHIKAYPAGASGRFGNYVRCVQGDTYGVNDFVANDDGSVTDESTGLMWQQADSGSGMNWEDALAYAESATTAGYDDWRLPNIKELQSIVDYSHSPSASSAANLGPAIDTGFFEITELDSGTTNTDPEYGYFWSSTSAYFGGDSLEYYYAWYVAFGTAVDGDGADMHGAGGMRFDTKYEGGPLGEGGERYYNYVRLVREAQ